jgi:hypothetical protein
MHKKEAYTVAGALLSRMSRQIAPMESLRMKLNLHRKSLNIIY